MGIVIGFPKGRRAAAAEGAQLGPASVVILPVIRIERHADEAPRDPPSEAAASGGRRRKRAARRS